MRFVYRSHYEGPLSRRVRVLPDETVLGGFQRGWAADDPQAWVEAELGGDMYGLESIFTGASEHRLPVPSTTDELRCLLHEHLYVEGGPDYIRLDDHSLRVRTDDDARMPPFAFPGTALPALTDRLIAVDPSVTAGWPPELRVLRALVTPNEPDLGAALARANRWPGFNLNAQPWPGLPDEHEAAHRLATDLVDAAEFTDGRRPEASLLRIGEHIAQMAMHCDDFFGYQQWYFFDTVWAASHPDLAQSLLRYANHWDPID